MSAREREMPVPKPNKGEEKNVFISRCVSTLKKSDPDRDGKQIQAMCYTSWRDSKGEKMERLGEINEAVDVIENVQVEYFVPITEDSTNDEKQFMISGTAVEATTSRNMITYTAEELNNALVENSPLLKDHDAKVDNIVGRVDFEKEEGRIKFKASIEDNSMKEKLAKKLIRNVSIGAFIRKLVKNVEEGVTSWTAKGIEILELSLVAIPGVKAATIDQAIMEKYGKQMINEEVIVEDNKMGEIEELKKRLAVLEQEAEGEELKEGEGEKETEPETEPEAEKDDETAEKVSTLTTELASLKRTLKEMQKSIDNKSKGLKEVKTTDCPEFAIGEITRDKYGNYSREWNPEIWKENIYR